MFLKLLAFIWVISGIVFLIKPLWMRGMLQKKGAKKMRGIFFGLALVLGGALIGATWGKEGILYKMVMIAGIVGIVKAFFFLNAKASEKVFEWFAGQSIIFFRLCAGAQLGFGLFLLYVK